MKKTLQKINKLKKSLHFQLMRQ